MTIPDRLRVALDVGGDPAGLDPELWTAARLGRWCVPPDLEPWVLGRLYAQRLPCPWANGDPPGVVLLVAVGTAASLWRFEPTSKDPAAHVLQPVAHSAWRDAGRAVDAHIRVRRFGHGPEHPRARFFYGTGADIRAVAPALLEGRSFGLAFALSRASLALGLSVPGDVVALAEVDELGSVTGVLGIEGKIEIIAENIARVRRVLVADNQHEVAMKLLGSHGIDPTTAVAVTSLCDALDLVWPGVAATLPRSLVDARLVDVVAHELLVLVCNRANAFTRWQPFQTLAERLFELANDDEPAVRARLKVVAAVAARHAGIAHMSAVELSGWVTEAAPEEPLTTYLYAHVFQQAVDAPIEQEPDLDWGHSYLPAWATYGTVPATVRGQPAMLELLGAWARFLAVRGAVERSFALQRALIGAWLNTLRPGEGLSFALSEAYRLVATFDGDAVGRLTDLDAVLASSAGSMDTFGIGFVTVARARARVLAGVADRGDLEVLRSFIKPADLPDFMCWTAWRWARLAGRRHDRDEAEAIAVATREALSAAYPGASAEDSALALAALDDALELGDTARTQSALEAIATLRREPTLPKLLSRCPHAEPLARAAWLQRTSIYG